MKILNREGFLNFVEGQLASVRDFNLADRCTGSIFESLNPGETVDLREGSFLLDEDLDLIN